MTLKIKEVKAREIIVKSKLPKASYVANPYTGCQFGCVYCYADFMRRMTGHGKDTWGEFVDVKSNAPDLAEGVDFSGKDVLFSSVTDAYQPIEGRYKITRQLLERLAAKNPQPDLGILTKSYLITRDIDVLKLFRKCTVGFSFSTLDDNVRRVIEPVTPTIAKRIEAAKAVHDAGIRTYVFMSPIMPYLSDVEQIFRTLRPHADFFMFENLNVRGNLWPRIRKALEKIDPALVPKYEAIYFKEGGMSSFWEPIEKQIREMCRREGMEPQLFFHHH